MKQQTLIKPPFEMREDSVELHFENGISVEFSWKSENKTLLFLLVYRESDNKITDLTYKFAETDRIIFAEEIAKILQRVSEVRDVKDIV